MKAKIGQNHTLKNIVKISRYLLVSRYFLMFPNDAIYCFRDISRYKTLNPAASMTRGKPHAPGFREIVSLIRMASKADMTPEEREAKEQEEFSTGPLRVLTDSVKNNTQVLINCRLCEKLFLRLA